MDTELIRVLSKAIEELGLEWSAPEEPSRSRLDEWFLPGCCQAPPQRAAPFFPEVHEELTKSWHAPYSARLRTSASHLLTAVDSAGQKGYEKIPPVDEAVAIHLCPPAAKVVPGYATLFAQVLIFICLEFPQASADSAAW